MAVVISAANHELLFGAMEAVKQRRQAQSQAAQAQSQAKMNVGAKLATAAAKPGAMGAKKPAAKGAKAGGGKAKAPANKAAAAGSGSQITPYLTANDLLGVGEAQAAAEDKTSNANFAYTAAAANALRNKGDIERGRVAGVSGANDDAAARGLYNSGIRKGNVGKVNTAAARGQEQNASALAMQAAQSVSQRNSAQQQLGTFMQGMAAKAAENGAALPVNPYQNGATNVKGAATVKKTKIKKAAKR